MIRISTIFIAVCMVLIAASIGTVLYSAAGFSGFQSTLVGLTVLTFFILYNAISLRLRERAEAGDQIADLSRGTADLARQIAEFGRRLAAVENRLASANSMQQERVQTVSAEIGELGMLVKQLAASVANHDEMLSAAAPAIRSPDAAPHGRAAEESDPPADEIAAALPAPAPSTRAPADDPEKVLGAVRNAILAGRIDIHLQPIVTLPQRKVRFYEVMARLRDETDQVLSPDEFLAAAESAGLMGRLDHEVMLRAVQVMRRLLVRSKEVGIFCNIGAATLSDPSAFAQCLDFLEANRALAPSFILEVRQSTLRNLGPREAEHLAALAQRGYRFSVDRVSDLRFEPRDLADRGVRFIKVPAALLLDPKQHPGADIHPADLSDLLGRFGIDLIAERIEGERAVVDLLDYDVRFGQGFLFAAPRPLRPETATAAAPASAGRAKQDTPLPNATSTSSQASPGQVPGSLARLDPLRATGSTALARRAVGPV